MLPFDSLTDNPNVQRLIAVVLFAVLLLAGLSLFVVLGFVGRRLGSGKTHRLAAAVIQSLSSVGAMILVVLGIFLGLTALPEAEPWSEQITQGGTIVLVAIGARALTNVLSAVIGWYVTNIAPTTASRVDDTILPIIRRFLSVAIFGIASLIILDTLGVSISPLLGGLGISGLAVALALQPTLSNFFAGAYVLSEGMISVGDYIELQGGPAGYVVNVGWRSTKIRTWLNNYVMIPNSVMSDSVITNYSDPDPRMNILVSCGVSYDSDLARVNEVALEVAKQVIGDNTAAVKTEEPWFGFDRFGDSNIDFWVFVQARDRLGSFIVTNELIKQLHARFREEGIEINYPVRKVVYEGGTPPAFAGEQSRS